MKKYKVLMLLFILIKLTLSQVPPPPLFSGETYTTMFSANYDYQGNGSVQLLTKNPAAPNEMIAVMMGDQDSTDPPPFSKRYTYTAITTNNGLNWYSMPLMNIRSGFPQTTIIYGTHYIVQHEGTPNTIKVYGDVVFGAFSYSIFTPPALLPNGTWGGIAGNPSGLQLSVFATVNNNASPFPIYKIISTNAGNNWIGSWTQVPNITGPSGSYSCFSAAGGLLGIIGFNYDSMLINRGSGTMYYYRSTNYGASFDSSFVFFRPYYWGDLDTVYHDIEAGLQGIYSGTEPHIVFGVYGSAAYVLPNNFLAYRHSKILHWSPSTGITTVANDTNSPAITDSINNTLLAPRCQPSIGRLSNGTLVCVFTGLTRGHTQVVGNGQTFVTGDIYVSYSSNNGLNWSQPGNFTNTPGIEEKSPSILPSSSDNIAKVIYFRDMKAGYYALYNEVGKSPYYCIMKKTDLTGINAVNTLAQNYSLSQNYPNPFNPVTGIEFSLPKQGFVNLAIFDALGRDVETLVNSQTNPGTYKFEWNAEKYPSGVYFCRIMITSSEQSFTKTMKMVIVK